MCVVRFFLETLQLFSPASSIPEEAVPSSLEVLKKRNWTPHTPTPFHYTFDPSKFLSYFLLYLIFL
jgi:hypothetical protein